MEGLIIMIIIGIITSVFNKKEKPKDMKQMPPFSNKSVPTQEPRQATTAAPKTLEDFANEIFGQLEKKVPEMKREVVIPKAEELQKPVRENPVLERPKRLTEQVVKESARKFEMNRGRDNIEQSARVKQMQEKTKQVFVTPKTQETLVQAIVTAEILGPPKAKQRSIR